MSEPEIELIRRAIDLLHKLMPDDEPREYDPVPRRCAVKRFAREFLASDPTTDATGNRVDFAFEGFDEWDEVSGKGWAELNGRKLTGRIVFHLGDESGFVAQKSGNAKR